MSNRRIEDIGAGMFFGFIFGIVISHGYFPVAICTMVIGGLLILLTKEIK
jgi:hypothetical protein